MGVKSSCPKHKRTRRISGTKLQNWASPAARQNGILPHPNSERSFDLGLCSGGPHWDSKSHNETSVFPFLPLPPTPPVTTSNIIHHLVFVAGCKNRGADGEINNNCSVEAQGAIRIQHGSKYKYKQTIFILLKDCWVLPPSLKSCQW